MPIDSSELIGEFVNNYHTIIKPFLESGNLETAKPAINDSFFRFKFAEQDLSVMSLPSGAYSRYLMILAHLTGLARTTMQLSPRIINREFLRVDRYVNELERLMSDNPEFRAQVYPQVEQVNYSNQGEQHAS